MATLTFDTLAFVKRLKTSGFTEKQAEALAQAQAELIDQRLATRHDIEVLRQDAKREIELLRRDTTREIEALRQETKSEIRGLELRLKNDLTVRMGALFAATVAVIAALKLFGETAT